MPRSADGRWTSECQVCGKQYQQRRPQQVACSVQCRGKLPHHTGGTRVKAGLAARSCPGCDAEFTPVRENQRACSRACRDALPDRRQAQRAYDNARREPHNEARSELRRELRRQDPEKVRAYNRLYNLRKYGLTPDDYDRMLAGQGGVCKLCGSPPDPGGVRAASRLHPDHDHVTGQNRDLLCLTCNVGIGHLRDDPALLRAAAEYIERHRAAVAERKP